MNQTPENLNRRDFLSVVLGISGAYIVNKGLETVWKVFPQQEDEIKRDGFIISGENGSFKDEDGRQFRTQVNTSALFGSLEAIAQYEKGELGIGMLHEFFRANPLRIHLFSNRPPEDTVQYVNSLYGPPHIALPTTIVRMYMECCKIPNLRERDLSWIEKNYLLHELYHYWQDAEGIFETVSDTVAIIGGAMVGAGAVFGRSIGRGDPIPSSIAGGVVGLIAATEASEEIKERIIENIDQQVESIYETPTVQQYRGDFIRYQRIHYS